MDRSVVDSFADWVHSSIFVPSVIVVATEQAQSSVKETNGITLAELFTPFGGHVANIPVNYSIAERGHFHNLAFKVPSVSFLDLADVEPPAASKNATCSQDYVIIDLFEQILRLNTSPALCKRGVLEGNAPRLKILLHDASDPESPSAAVLEQMLAQLKGTFNPATVCVLRINRVNSLLNGVGVGAAGGAAAPDGGSGPSSRSGAGGVVPDNFGVAKIFEKFALKKGKYKYSNVANAAAGGTSKNDASSAPAAAVAAATGEHVGENYLRSLTMADCNEVQAIVKAFVKDMAVPWVERKLQMLDAQIASNRRGFQNTMKSLFRKPKEAGSGEFSAEGVGGGNGNSAGAGGKLAVYNLNTTE
eukprot:g10514.t1